MCGIAGYIDIEAGADERIVHAMVETLRHRGPDDSGAVCLGNVALGHRRLSIIDLSPNGRQPMGNRDGSVWILFNGEFYNFAEHRSDLARKGYRFSSQTDTEVILYLYEEYGIEETLKRMNGMFAFSLYDAARRRLFVVRDRLGIKPCYWAQGRTFFMWGSELKALLAHPKCPREMSREALADYFAYLYIPDDRCVFRGVEKVRPGHYLEVDTATLALIDHEYWDVAFEPDATLTEARCVEELDHLIRDAVKLRLVSDVPLGAFVSGGIDSSTIVSYMAELMSEPVKTFTIGFHESDFSEVAWARAVSDKYRTDHYEETVDPNAVEVLPELVYHYDEPFADSSAIPTYYVSKVARRHVTVILSGDGGDENFGGYIKYAHTLRIMRLRSLIPRIVRERLLPLLYRASPQSLPGRNIINMIRQDEEMVYAYKMRFFNDDVLRDLFLQPVSAENIFAPYLAKVSGIPHTSRMQYLDFKTYLPMDILTKVDRASMAFGLETRVPLLDYRIVEYAAKIPPALHVKNGSKKYLLKRILSGRFGFDDSFLNRRKMGFEVPLSRWFKGTLESYARENLCDRNSAVGEFLDARFIGTLITRHKRGVRDYSSQIWAMLFLEFWLRRWRRT